VVIQQVFVAVTGDHVQSFNNRGTLDLLPDTDEITEEDVRDVNQQARKVQIPNQHAFIHTLVQHYSVDGKDSVPDPVGMPGTRLEADFHIIHGVRTRIQNTIRCVREIPIEVGDIVFSPLASAQSVLTTNQKNLGALVVDFGGGTCDYILYLDGVVRKTGCVPIGGDHITNDIAVGLKIPVERAERLKTEEGSALLGNCLPEETVFVKDETGLSGKEVGREMLNTIINLRVTETLELVKKRANEDGGLDYIGHGVCLTGGSSYLHGIDHIAKEVFDLPIHLGHPQKLSGVLHAWDSARFSTPVGLIKYAQTLHIDQPRSNLLSHGIKFISSIFKKQDG
jgi:cell division protein FtsA